MMRLAVRDLLRRAWETVRALAARAGAGARRSAPLLATAGRRTAGFAWWLLGRAWRTLALTAKAIVILLLVIAGLQIFVVTDRDRAYRYSGPDQPQCKDATPARRRVLAGSADNDELAAIAADQTRTVAAALTCMLQEHEVPVDATPWPNGRTMDELRYRLAFLEFTQDGRPAELGADDQPLQASQLDALLSHLKAHPADEHYVIAFIHGWRHDARIGDGNVAALRVYAASFLDYRCKVAGRNCGAKVTGVYIGWRGARIDERSWLGALFGTRIGTVLAAPTLFDRKPVSERIAPAAIAALKEIDNVLDELEHKRQATELTKNKMITFGHSLGGNMLAVALKDRMVDRVERHQPYRLMKAPFGDLIVLINPASEATNWTAIQRAMRKRIVLERSGEETEAEFSAQVTAGHQFFRRDQPPIYISLTSAYAWPAGGIRRADLAAANSKAAKTKMQDYRRQASYDWATHDVFPLFKADLRPLAETLERNAETAGNGQGVCDDDLCKLWRSLQFVNCSSASECGLRLAATVYGTTHEFVVNQDPGTPTQYRHAGSPQLSECAVVDHWLWKARKEVQNDYSWDSGYSYGGIDRPGQPQNRTPIRPRTRAEGGHLESQFVHGYHDGGMLPISRGNDPFWNMRAFDTALKEHDGFVFYPLICAINQLVMDRVAARPASE